MACNLFKLFWRLLQRKILDIPAIPGCYFARIKAAPFSVRFGKGRCFCVKLKYYLKERINVPQ